MARLSKVMHSPPAFAILANKNQRGGERWTIFIMNMWKWL
jgi:hypothetical protein